MYQFRQFMYMYMLIVNYSTVYFRSKSQVANSPGVMMVEESPRRSFYSGTICVCTMSILMPPAVHCAIGLRGHTDIVNMDSYCLWSSKLFSIWLLEYILHAVNHLQLLFCVFLHRVLIKRMIYKE